MIAEENNELLPLVERLRSLERKRLIESEKIVLQCWREVRMLKKYKISDIALSVAAYVNIFILLLVTIPIMILQFLRIIKKGESNIVINFISAAIAVIAVSIGITVPYAAGYLFSDRDEKYDYKVIYYFLLLRKRIRLVEVILIITIIFLYAVEITNTILLYSLIIFVISFYAKDFLIGYRVKNGLFGTNRTEARELIDFIIKNSDNLDFTDSNGNLRRALLPEAKEAVEEYIPSALGEEARA